MSTDPLALAAIVLSFFHSYFLDCAEGEDGEKGKGRELVSWGAEKWRGMRCLPRTPTYAEKAPRIVKMKPTPRTIQQPR